MEPTTRNFERTVLPLPPTAEDKDKFDMEVYAKFMRHLRHVPNSRMEIKILSSIQFTADLMDCNEALVAKTLVDHGLRSPRKAFPTSYLEFVDNTLMRASWSLEGVAPSIRALRDYWDEIGEEKFISARRSDYEIYQETNFVSV